MASTNRSSPSLLCSVLALPTAFPSPCLTCAFPVRVLPANEQSPADRSFGKLSASKASKGQRGTFARFARLLAVEVGHGVGPANPLLATLPPHATGLCSFARKAKRMSGRAMSLFVVADDEPWRGDRQRHLRRRWAGRRGATPMPTYPTTNSRPNAR